MDNRHNQNLFHQMIGKLPVVIYRCSFDHHLTIQFISDAIEEFTGRPASDFISGKYSLLSCINQNSSDEVFEAIQKALITGERYSVSLKVFNRNGTIRWVQNIGKGEYNQHGQLLYIDGVMIDIDERKKADEALQYQYKFQKMVAEISSSFVNIDLDQIDQAVNKALELSGSFFSVDRSYVFQISEDNLSITQTHEWHADGIDSLTDINRDLPLYGGLPWPYGEKIVEEHGYHHIPDVSQLPPEAENEKQRYLKQGIKSLLVVATTDTGIQTGFIGYDSIKKYKSWSDEDISLLRVVAEIISSAFSRQKADRKLKYLSLHDQLTGAYNRFYFEEELNKPANRYKYPLTIITFDLDGLKLINDTMGHDIGDQLLIESAELIRKSLRSSDTLARVGGDEFAAFLPQTDVRTAEKLVQQIRNNLEEYNLKNDQLPLGLSIGVATADNPNIGLKDLYKRADDLMCRDKLYQSSSSRNKIVKSLVAAISERDYIAEGHVQRLEYMCRALGEELGLASRQLSDLTLLAQVHDLGKVGIPDKILYKNSQLNGEEWNVMRSHSEKGYRIASSSDDLSGIADLILKHHEHWDGSGYPLGLEGEEIPVACRILALVDAYDAMTSQRSYNKKKNRAEAIAELKKHAGSQFDPHIVKVFFTVLDELSDSL